MSNSSFKYKKQGAHRDAADAKRDASNPVCEKQEPDAKKDVPVYFRTGAYRIKMKACFARTGFN